MSEVVEIGSGASQPSLLAVIERAATNPETDIEKMRALLDMHERITRRSAEAAFNDAMAKAQSEMTRVAADKENTQTRSWYPTYGKLDRVLRPIYSRHGFSLSFDTGESGPEQVRVLCYVSCAGFTRTYHADMPADGKGAKGGDVMTKTHATGSAMSYGMRYLLKMIFNVAIGEDDDDGNKADGGFITPEQRADLAALMEEVKADKAKFLEYLKIEDLALLPAESFNKAIKALEAKRKKTA